MALTFVVGALGALAAAAFACSNLATMILSTNQGHPGNTVTLTGASFVSPRPTTGVAPTLVVIHWDGENGPVLTEATPDRFGSISATFTVPEGPPGVHVIVATQLTARPTPGAAPDAPPVLVPEIGTPARSSFEILPAGVSPTVVRAPLVEQVTESSGDLDTTVWIVLTAAFGAVALSLFGGGLVAFLYQSRQSKLPAEARWVPPGWYS